MKNSKTIITAHAAITLDRKIARHSGESTYWTSPEDKIHFRACMDASEVVVVGNNTYRVAHEFLSKRNCVVLTSLVGALERRNEKLLLWNPEGIPMRMIFRKYRKIALIGGAQVYTYFLDRDLIDEFYLTIEPIRFGEGLDLFTQNVSMDTVFNTMFNLVSHRTLNDTGTVLRHYERRREARV